MPLASVNQGEPAMPSKEEFTVGESSALAFPEVRMVSVRLEFVGREDKLPPAETVPVGGLGLLIELVGLVRSGGVVGVWAEAVVWVAWSRRRGLPALVGSQVVTNMIARHRQPVAMGRGPTLTPAMLDGAWHSRSTLLLAKTARRVRLILIAGMNAIGVSSLRLSYSFCYPIGAKAPSAAQGRQLETVACA